MDDLKGYADRLSIERRKLEAIAAVLEVPEHLEGLIFCLDNIAIELEKIETDLTRHIRVKFKEAVPGISEKT